MTDTIFPRKIQFALNGHISLQFGPKSSASFYLEICSKVLLNHARNVLKKFPFRSIGPLLPSNWNQNIAFLYFKIQLKNVFETLLDDEVLQVCHMSKALYGELFKTAPDSFTFYTLNYTYFPCQIVCLAIFNFLLAFLYSYSCFQFFIEPLSVKYTYTQHS